MASRSVYHYVPEAFGRLLEDDGLTIEALASATDISARHYGNILSGQTPTCRFRTRKKIQLGLAELGVAPHRIDELFTR